MTRKSILWITLAIVLSGILFFAVPKGKVLTRIFKLGKEKELIGLADSLNKKCPMQVDNITTLQSVKVTNSAWQYNYKLNIDSIALNFVEFKKQSYERLLKELKMDPNSKNCSSMNLTIVYNYQTLKGKFLFEFIYPPELYDMK